MMKLFSLSVALGWAAMIRADTSSFHWTTHKPHATANVVAEEVDLGTTLVAIRYQDGVVVAADSRTSVGGYVSNRYATKLVPITSHCLVMRSGSAADTQNLALACRHYFRQRQLRLSTIESSLSSLLPSPIATTSQIAQWMRRAVVGNPSGQASLLVAGWDNNRSHSNGGSGHIYSVALSGALLSEQQFAAAGSGSVFVLGFLDQALGTTTDDEGLVSEERAIALCQQAIRLAAQRDGSSGGLIRLSIINENGIRTLPPQPIVVANAVLPSGKDTNNADRGLDGFHTPR